MGRRVSVQEASACLEALLAAAARGEEITIERDGLEFGVILAAARYHTLAGTGERFWRLVDVVQSQNPELSEEVAELIAVQAVKEVRDERWFEAQ